MRKIIFISALMIPLVFVLLSGCVFVYNVPDNAFSVFLFKVGYQTPWGRHAFLQGYSPVRRDVNAGGIPSDVDKYLCQRVETTADLDEIAAVTDFYVTQARGREGSCIFLVNDTAKRKIVEHLIGRLRLDDDQSENIVVIIEQIRIGISLGKGSLGKSSLETEMPSTAEEWRSWSDRIGLPTARQKYIEWWELPIGWTEKKTLNPLEGARVAVHSCC